MKNITKTTKTILFASLIAALVLPFSGMDYAEADSSKMIEKVKELKEKAKNEKPTSKQEIKEKEKRLERLDMVEELVFLESKGKGDSKEHQKILKKLIKALDKYSKKEMRYAKAPEGVSELGSGDSNSISEMDSVGLQKAFAATTNYDTSDILRSDCGTGSFGDSHGYITAWGTNSYVISSLVSGTDYPSSMTVNCVTKSFDSGFTNFYDFLNPAGTCFGSFDSSTYIRGGYCDNMVSGDILLINSQASYQGTNWSNSISYQWVII